MKKTHFFISNVTSSSLSVDQRLDGTFRKQCLQNFHKSHSVIRTESLLIRKQHPYLIMYSNKLAIYLTLNKELLIL